MREPAPLIFSTLAACILAAGSLTAQTDSKSKPPVYTYIAEFATPRAQWADMEKIDDLDKPVMEKLVANGTITGYGAYTKLLHQEGEATHGTWFTATSEGKLMKGLEALYANPGSTTAPVEAASKHWDFIMVSNLYNQRSGKSENGYLTSTQWDVKPGQMRAYMETAKSVYVPVLEKLLADGCITAYGIETEDYHTQKLGRVISYFTTADADGLDKANAALEEAFAKNPTLAAAVQSMTERDGHRDSIYRLRYMSNK